MPKNCTTYVHFGGCSRCAKIFVDAFPKVRSSVDCPVCKETSEPLKIIQQITLFDRVPGILEKVKHDQHSTD